MEPWQCCNVRDMFIPCMGHAAAVADAAAAAEAEAACCLGSSGFIFFVVLACSRDRVRACSRATVLSCARALVLSCSCDPVLSCSRALVQLCSRAIVQIHIRFISDSLKARVSDSRHIPQTPIRPLALPIPSMELRSAMKYQPLIPLTSIPGIQRFCASCARSIDMIKPATLRT